MAALQISSNRGTRSSAVAALPRQATAKPWTFVSSIFQRHPHRLVLHLKIVDWTFINLIVEPGEARTGSLESRLLRAYTVENKATATRDYSSVVEEVLDLCRKTYASTAPQFARNLRLITYRSGPTIREEFDPLLLSSLRLKQDVFDELEQPLPPTVSSGSLETIIESGAYFLPNTRLVRYQNREYVAKGPIYATRVDYDYQEIRNLLSLPQGHPNIISRPAALVTVSENDHRICGFLTPYYRKGNLDIYARRLRSRGELTAQHLCKWFAQLASAVEFLADHQTWHGDIKPDNILMDDDENVVLIDFARAFATSATASPEVRKYLSDNAAQACVTSVGIPENWPLETVVSSEVYSVGRTIYLVCEGTSMLEIYKTNGWVNHECEFSNAFGEDTIASKQLQATLARCLAEDSAERISLDELCRVLPALEGLCRVRSDSVMDATESV